MSRRANGSGAVAIPASDDPYDAGALLLAAVTAHRAATGLSQAEVARAAGLLPPALSRALRNPNARPALVRRVLAVTGHRLALQR